MNTGFREVADRVFVARYERWDVNVGLVLGRDGAVVVDTRASDLQGSEVLEDIRALGRDISVRHVANTHVHFDHTFGNAAFRQEYADLPIHATEEAAARTVLSGERWKAGSDKYDDPRVPDIRATEIVPADRTFSSADVIDLGDRVLELVHPGRGHTGGDLVVRVPDADVLLAGDLVEESAPPVYGVDSFPLEWPLTMDLVTGLLTADTVVVPGHGAIPPRPGDLVRRTRDYVVALQAQMRSAVEKAVPMRRALATLPPADSTRPVSPNSRRRRNAARVYVEEERKYMGLDEP